MENQKAGCVGKRRDARLLAVQFLYQQETAPQPEVEESLSLFWEMTAAAPGLQKLAKPAIMGVLTHAEELTALIKKFAQNWDLKRMAPVDICILRLALYEMHHCLEIPPVVSINEAIEIAKQISTDDSGRFVNGILDHARAELSRPARMAAKK